MLTTIHKYVWKEKLVHMYYVFNAFTHIAS